MVLADLQRHRPEPAEAPVGVEEQGEREDEDERAEPGEQRLKRVIRKPWNTGEGVDRGYDEEAAERNHHQHALPRALVTLRGRRFPRTPYMGVHDDVPSDRAGPPDQLGDE